MPAIKKQQTPIDFVAQQAGSVEGLFDVALNNGLSITDQPAPGTNLQVEVIDQQATKVFAVGGIDITTLYNPSHYVRQGGIGFMQIGNDFIVS